MDAYKAAVIRVCRPAEQVPLEEPPLPDFDVGTGNMCPNCGEVDPGVAEVESAEVARCPSCGCEYTPTFESMARIAVRHINERRRSRRRALSSLQHRTAVKNEFLRLAGV